MSKLEPCSIAENQSSAIAPELISLVDLFTVAHFLNGSSEIGKRRELVELGRRGGRW